MFNVNATNKKLINVLEMSVPFKHMKIKYQVGTILPKLFGSEIIMKNHAVFYIQDNIYCKSTQF